MRASEIITLLKYNLGLLISTFFHHKAKKSNKDISSADLLNPLVVEIYFKYVSD